MEKEAQKQARKKEGLKEEIQIPEGLQVTVSGADVTVKGPKGELKRNFTFPWTKIVKDGNKIIVTSEKSRKSARAFVGSFVAHMNNMFTGVTKGFKYTMKVVFSHFPMNVKVVGKKIEITNFFGEKKPRHAKIIGNVKVNAGKEEIIIEGANVEEVGQTMSNIELATRIKYKDSRIFQDGIYLTNRE